MLAQYADKENNPVDVNQGESSTRGGNASPGGFFRKRSSARSKSLGKDHWDSAFLGKNLCVIEQCYLVFLVLFYFRIVNV